MLPPLVMLTIKNRGGHNLVGGREPNAWLPSSLGLCVLALALPRAVIHWPQWFFQSEPVMLGPCLRMLVTKLPVGLVTHTTVQWELLPLVR